MSSSGQQRLYDLKAETELRLEIAPNETVTCKLVKGTAEIYGCELCPNREYRFSGVKYAIFTFDGASIQITGVCYVEYTSSECVVPFYMNLHLCLEGLRSEACSSSNAHRPQSHQQQQPKNAPRVLILGNGRGVCTRTLLNYSIRSGRIPLFVDLDVSNGVLVFPGVVAAASMHRMIEPEEGFYMSSPLAFYYGSTGIGDNFKWLCKIIEKIGQASLERIQHTQESSTSLVRQSGLFAVFPPWIEGKSEEMLKVTIKALQISMIVVVGNERLSSSIQKTWENERIQIINISKSSGLVNRETSFRRFQMFQRIREYFYGFCDEYYPYSNTVSIKDVTIWKIEDRVAPPVSALPIGAESKLEELSYSKVEITQNLLYSVLGISSVAGSINDEDNAHELSEACLLGFVHVTEVDLQKEKITFLCTSPGKLPNNILILGNIKWLEHQAK